MSWLTRLLRRSPPPERRWDAATHVDLDRDSIPLGDSADPSSLFLTLSMNHGSVYMTVDPKTNESVLKVADRTFRGPDDVTVLREATQELDARS